ncbi:MAG: biopolymer transporter ExbD [Pseudomonadales bacterium]|jgi:biopolymer transport protein ExbD|nr:biopolymer transporter ExbD [Pseudomonadales bacterium]
MQARRHSGESEDHGIDLAPMLDFVMNLLIFFIITTSFVKESGVSVTQVLANTGEQNENGNIIISVRENGDIWMNRKRVDLRQVRPTVERFHIERPTDEVFVVPDAAANVDILVKVMDEVRAAGLRNTGIGSSPTGG